MINQAEKNLNAPRLDGPEIGHLCDSQQAYFNLIYCIQLQPADALQATYLALETMSQWVPVIRNTLSCCFHQRPQFVTNIKKLGSLLRLLMPTSCYQFCHIITYIFG